MLGRFLHEEITSLPDIDLDFPRDIREKLIPRVHERYGTERAALVAAFATYRWKGVIRDLGKALGLPAGEIERVARSADVYGDTDDFRHGVAEAIGPRRADSERWRALIELGPEAYGLPRHASQHPGGMVISTEPLIDLCPVQPSAMEGRNLVQWDKDSCADAGFLKIDLLGLGMLSAVERCVDEIARVRGERIDLSRTDYDDAEVYETIQRAETTGVFQIESRAQMQSLRRTKPRTLDDLTVQVALVRPGPIQGGAVHPYIERRERLRADPDYEMPYPHPLLEPVLGETLGVIVFQDQVLEVAIALAGFTPGEAEGLRRAMSRKRSEAAILVHRDRFIEGAMERGVERALAERIFEQVRGFSGLRLPEGARGGVRAARLPVDLAAGALRAGVPVRAAERAADGVLSPGRARARGAAARDDRAAAAHRPQRRRVPGRETIAGAHRARLRPGREGGRGEGAGGGARPRGPFADAGDLAARSGAGRDTLERLAWAGACDDLPRREALWQMGVVTPGRAVPGGVQLSLPLPAPEAPALRELNDWERMLADYGSFRISIAEHPMELMRPELQEAVLSSRGLERAAAGSRVTVAGMVIARQRPATAKGVTFMLLEDEFGTVNLIVAPPVYQRHRLAVRAEPFVIATGRLERRTGTTNVVVEHIAGLERPDLPLADVKHIEPPAGRETGRPEEPAIAAAAAGDLRAVLPAPHSFGRRGR